MKQCCSWPSLLPILWLLVFVTPLRAQSTLDIQSVYSRNERLLLELRLRCASGAATLRADDIVIEQDGYAFFADSIREASPAMHSSIAVVFPGSWPEDTLWNGGMDAVSLLVAGMDGERDEAALLKESSKPSQLLGMTSDTAALLRVASSVGIPGGYWSIRTMDTALTVLNAQARSHIQAVVIIRSDPMTYQSGVYEASLLRAMRAGVELHILTSIPADTAIRALATATGGSHHIIRSKADIAAAVDAIHRQLRARREHHLISAMLPCANGKRHVARFTIPACDTVWDITREYLADSAATGAGTLRFRLGTVSTLGGGEALLPVFLDSLPRGGVLYPFSFEISLFTSDFEVIGVASNTACLLSAQQLRFGTPDRYESTVSTDIAYRLLSPGLLFFLRVQCDDVTALTTTTIRPYASPEFDRCEKLLVDAGTVSVYPRNTRTFLDIVSWKAELRQARLRFAVCCDGAWLEGLQPWQVLIHIDSVPRPLLSLKGGELGQQYEADVAFGCADSREHQLRVEIVDACLSPLAGQRKVIAARATPSIRVLGPDFLCMGDSTTLEVTDYGDMNSFRWSTGERTRSIVVHKPDAYVVAANDTMGTCQSVVASVNIQGPLDEPLVPAGKVLLCAGDTLIVRTARPFATYEWSTGARTPTLAVTAAGRYSAVVHDTSGCGQRTLELLVDVVNEVHPEIQTPSSLTLCEGQGIPMLVKGFYGSYLWSTGETSRGIVARQPGQYWVRVQLNGGCSGVSDTVTIVGTNEARPRLHASATTICSNDSVTLTLSDAGVSRRWSNGSTQSSIIVKMSDQYWAEVTLPSGCVFLTDTVRISVLAAPVRPYITRYQDTLSTVPAHSYQWYHEMLPIPGATQWKLALRATGIYHVRIGNALGCSALSLEYKVDALTSVDHVAPEEDVLLLYPQPAQDYLHVRAIAPLSGPVNYCVRDMLGRTWLHEYIEWTPGDSPLSLDIRALPEGVYMLEVERSGRRQVKMFLRQ